MSGSQKNQINRGQNQSQFNHKHSLIEVCTASPVSPASRTNTVVLLSSDSREARTNPAVPPPAMMKSYESARALGSVIILRAWSVRSSKCRREPACACGCGFGWACGWLETRGRERRRRAVEERVTEECVVVCRVNRIIECFCFVVTSKGKWQFYSLAVDEVEGNKEEQRKEGE